MVTKEWVAIHRKHHAHCETDADPHSPTVHGLNALLTRGAELYMDARADGDTVAQYGQGTPQDWIERHLYTPHSNWGPTLYAMVAVVLFGVGGMAIWAIQMMWIPFWAAGIVNGLAHWWGYRNYETADRSTNLVPIGLWIGGEELHNNHHAFPSSARFSLRRYEFDIGWIIIRALSAIGLARVKRVANVAPDADVAAHHATLTPRVRWVTVFFRDVMLPVLEKTQRAQPVRLPYWLRRALADGGRWLGDVRRARFDALLDASPILRTLSGFRDRLDATLADRSGERSSRLDDWIQSALSSEIASLRRFAAALHAAVRNESAAT
jgi:stearoyl-CoA desaturase (delta-9 desaturase)